VGTKHNIISDCFSSTNSTTLDTVVSDPDKFLSSLDLHNIKCGEFKCLARDPNASGVGYLISSNDPDLQFEAEIKYSWILECLAFVSRAAGQGAACVGIRRATYQ